MQIKQRKMSKHKEILLIDEELLKQVSPITDNVDLDNIFTFVGVAQETYIRVILGDALFDELRKQIKENNLTEANSELIYSLAKCLAFYSMYEALPFHSFKFVNKGIVSNSSQNSEAGELGDVNSLMRNTLRIANNLESVLIRYLYRCREKYPNWKPKNIDCIKELEIENGKAQAEVFLGIHIEKTERGCSCE